MTAPPIPVRTRIRVPARLLVAILVAWLGLDTILLWRFLDWGGGWGSATGAVAVVVLAIAAARAVPDGDHAIGLRGLGGCFALAVLLFLLGGEGRLFYANVDWIVRDAVLRDMAVHPWPFAYTARGTAELLRAPIGMYLVPSIAFGAGGQAAGDWALLIQNSALLAILLALAAPLFTTRVARLIGLAVVIAFSGLDVIGAMLADGVPGFLARDHLEWWSGLQFSAHVTQIFWAPQHALAGWIGAVAFMLWRDARIPAGVFLMLVPLTLLWSPLAALGIMPFAALAVLRDRRALGLRDVMLPGAALLLSLPTILYLGAAGESVGVRVAFERWPSLAAFHLLETLPFAWIAVRQGPYRFGRDSALIAISVLLMVSVVRVGWSTDLTMRASIPALAILSVVLADRVVHSRGKARVALVALAAIGAVTGATEIARAIRWPAPPTPRCGFIAAFDSWGPNPNGAKSNYLAPVAALPEAIRPRSVTLVPPADPPQCLASPWPRPTGLF